ncbi:MAG: glycoside hydrolase family 18 protein, partial [Chroococcidiopsidaceae cyanobacterium CP_BM_RX_35]|nr:glycoside hydrolase family 18 protein [Chroococcidiopsidaceae cyanobacterium CP_BM_RX_35]
QYLDWVNLKAYDFYTGSSSTTHFSAALYSVSSDPEPDPQKRSSNNVDAAVKAYLSAGVPTAKLVVGVPFFGYGWEGVPNVNHGLYQPAGGLAQGTWTNDGVFDYEDLSSNYFQTFLRYWSMEASAPWLYSPDAAIMIGYDDPQSLGLKADYVNFNNLGGIMIWPLSADDSKSTLVRTLALKLNLSQPTGSNPSPVPQPATSATTDNSTRRIPKATYVSLTIPTNNSRDSFSEGRAVMKFSYVRQLGLQPGEVDAAWTGLSLAGSLGGDAMDVVSNGTLADTLRMFEGSPMPSLLPAPSVFATVPSSALLAFGKSVIDLRKQSLTKLNHQSSNAALPPASSALSTLPTQQSAHALTRVSATSAPKIAPMSLDLSTTIGRALNLTNKAIGATNVFEADVTATPIGMLNLERLEMTPAGIERGELLATIPLAPMEQTAVVQKEWSVTSQEFTSIVTDSLDNYSETGVTENTDLSQSTTSQTQHSNQFNINATVSGGCGFVTGSVSTGFTAQDSNSQSATDSRKHAVETTRKASSRVKQEHKMTISTTTVTGTSETTTRTLQNPSATDPMRIDYFSMMRKWRVGLYRYGLRLTYDIAIPEPAGTLREAYMQLSNLQSQASTVFTMPLKISDITAKAYTDPSSPLMQYATQWGVPVPPPPESPGPTLSLDGVPPLADDDSWHFFTLPFNVPDGYWVTDISVKAQVGFAEKCGNNKNTFGVPAASYQDSNNNQGYEVNLTKQSGFMKQATGSQTITFFFQCANTAWVGLTVQTDPTDTAVNQWAATVWDALNNAGQTAFYAQQQALNSQIQALQDQINNVDTLTLRREENDEIMKGVLRWLLGPAFEFMPSEVFALFGVFGSPPPNPAAYNFLTHGVSFTGNDLAVYDPTLDPTLSATDLSVTDWSTMFNYQEMVKFVNEAIEWENVLYFLYSYFWDVPLSWNFIRQIKHPDATRQAFLRAGSSRVVLTIRKGWENAWVSFVETGGFTTTLIPEHPYMSIVQEMQAYDDTNYPGIPAANPASGPTADPEDSVATTSSGSVPASTTAVTIPVDSNAGFIVGYTAVIDSYGSVSTTSSSYVSNPVSIPVNSSTGFVVGQAAVIDTADSGFQETQIVTSIPDPTHITVQMLKYDHNGALTPFPIVQNIQESQIITAIPDAPDTTHITVQKLNYPHDGRTAPFPVVQPGEKGILISEWFEYTPTSGTDIAVTSNLAKIS